MEAPMIILPKNEKGLNKKNGLYWLNSWMNDHQDSPRCSSIRTCQIKSRGQRCNDQWTNRPLQSFWMFITLVMYLANLNICSSVNYSYFMIQFKTDISKKRIKNTTWSKHGKSRNTHRWKSSHYCSESIGIKQKAGIWSIIKFNDRKTYPTFRHWL